MNYLWQIYNDIWNSDDIPKIWKQITVIPIPKPLKDNTIAKNKKTAYSLIITFVPAKH